MSCGNNNTKNVGIEPQEANQQKKTISAKAIENFKYNDYILSSDAEKEVRDWSKFQELSTQISFLKRADITFFTSEKDTLKVFLDSLKVNIPENINTNSVIARVSTLETKLLKLNDDLTLENYNAENKLKSIKELLIANSNLIYVINKKLEFDLNDVGRPEDEE
ncbi:hypothetical protein [Winogradskyella sp.]|uniref:hypothetical protein n=1 Tax=Winogradskyella sp. TaxID=1883156 RepID=UPI0025E843CA|nr:hypothetical protein [Winogradskyella sp.]